VDQLDVMDRDVGAGVSPADPLGELAAADLLRFQKRAITVVDMSQHPVGNVRAELLVVRVGELVINDLGEYAVLSGNRVQLIELLQPEHGRLFDENMLGCLQREL